MASRQAEWGKRNREKVRAHLAVKAAIKDGRLMMPEHCERCPNGAPLIAHHAQGYEPEHYLEVEWLCRPCHQTHHRRPKHASDNDRGIMVRLPHELLEAAHKLAALDNRSLSSWIRQQIMLAARKLYRKPKRSTGEPTNNT